MRAVEMSLENGAERFVKDLGESLCGLYRTVVDIKEAKRLQAMTSKRGVICNFDVRDFVLWSRIDARLPTRKRWGRWHEVHGTKLKFYHDAPLNTTQEICELVTERGILLDVEAFKEHRFNEVSKTWQLRVSWIRLQDVADSWESLCELVKDVPIKVAETVTRATDGDLADAFKQLTLTD
ncbi:hypothetical protein PC116_g27685 [Phytophthora cactorum]|nr:hypothetical protein PC119_g13359 [Phytophthora cactorum]KAG3124653.1 hypothetical protein C6341_g26084 [Phytophthora cactorum]KAG4223856.1 hypothetical protein PC116_g27685 [Phytophthora cactorum]